MANVDRYTFLAACREHRIPTAYPPEELEADLAWLSDNDSGSLTRTASKAKGIAVAASSVASASHLTVVTLSDLEVYRFALELFNLAPTAGGCFAEARYELIDGPVAGATLEILGNAEVFYANAGDELIDVDSLQVFEQALTEGQPSRSAWSLSWRRPGVHLRLRP